ncbi:MAG: DNA recombination protein RmuC [Bacteroidia bacterium]|nr:DNA recombination protein RmuC [Bacteroidia bacterium]
MTKEIIFVCIIAAFLVVLVWLLTHVIVTLRWKSRLIQAATEKKAAGEQAAAEKAALMEKAEAEKDALERMLKEKERDAEERILAYNQRLEEQKQQQKEVMDQQMATLRAEMAAESEKVLKAREEELSRKAKETFENISGGLSKDLNAMKEAFEAGKKSQAEDSATLKERFEAAVRSLETQSREIGGKADHLANALRGQKKMQGCWGETILANLLNNEGLVEGRDYEKEATLRDDLGFVIPNEDSDKRMRPDFIFHLPEGNDIVIDAKVSLAAFLEYNEKEDPAEKADASKRNLLAVKEQVKRLARKEYEKYLRPGHRMLDYTVMFVPNYPALQLAYSEEPALWRDAYSQGVLITSEETLVPFLRMISIAWTNVEQVRNQQQIIASAQMMIDRVADFAKAHAEMGKKLEDAQECYIRCADKLKDSGHSIVQSARQVVKLGVPANPKKPLPEE